MEIVAMVGSTFVTIVACLLVLLVVILLAKFKGKHMNNISEQTSVVDTSAQNYDLGGRVVSPVWTIISYIRKNNIEVDRIQYTNTHFSYATSFKGLELKAYVSNSVTNKITAVLQYDKKFPDKRSLFDDDDVIKLTLTREEMEYIYTNLKEMCEEQVKLKNELIRKEFLDIVKGLEGADEN